VVAPAEEKHSASLMKALTRQLLSFLIVGELVGFSSGALNAAEMPSPARRSESGRTEDQTHLRTHRHGRRRVSRRLLMCPRWMGGVWAQTIGHKWS